MKQSTKNRSSKKSKWHYLGKGMSLTIILFSVSLLLVTTLSPFNFYFKEDYGNLDYYLIPFEWGKSDILDVLKNILLFLPFGFGLASYLIRAKKLAGFKSLIITIVICFVFSYSIEVLQFFLPSRYPSLVDILSNSAGGILGLLCFLFWECKVVDCNSLLMRRNLQIICIGYLIFVILISISLQHFSGFSNWDNSFYLLIGNELTQDRPWQGYISEIYIVDRAISETEVAQIYSKEKRYDSMGKSLIASYQLIGVENYHDRTENLPELIWRGKPKDVHYGEGAYLGPNHWLETAAPAIKLTQRLMRTSQFTISVTLATGASTQTGPARIISLSKDTDNRNFTLAQKGSGLVFRIRTPLTGVNGSEPRLKVPKIFANRKLQTLTITYNGTDLLLYVDGVRNSHTLEFNPGTILFSHLFGLNSFNMICFKTFYYAIVFIPLGILMTLTAEIMRSRFVIKILIIFAGLLLTPLILENIMVSVSGRDLKLENLLISILFMASPYVFLKYVTPHLLEKKPSYL